VLRQTLDDESLEQAAAEGAAVAGLLRDNGVVVAATDPGLGNLRSLLAEHPGLAALLARISVWYDYSCLPQRPRTQDEEALFRQGLEALNVCQVLGITLVLLDDAEDYLTRAWCTLEGLVADSVGSIDTLVGSRRSTAAAGRVEDSFELLLQDRPHLVWRALLDTEVFGVQDAEACLRRLSLAATDRNDLPFIYERLRSLRAPRKIHVQGPGRQGPGPTGATAAGWPGCTGPGSWWRSGSPPCRKKPSETCAGPGPTWSPTAPAPGIGWACSCCATVGPGGAATPGR
jgi:hypothetical protein